MNALVIKMDSKTALRDVDPRHHEHFLPVKKTGQW